MSLRSRLLLLTALAWLASAPAVHARRDLTVGALQEGTAVRMVAPLPGATLVAGTTAEVEWEPLARFAELLPRTEEWEAFLSLDDGKTYPMRITPHLDEDLRRFRWQVPPLPTPHARILLRFGDERKETSVLVPRRFAILAPPAGTPALNPAWGAGLSLFVRRSAGLGEAALPGQAGVVAWVEGSRRGGGLRQVVAGEAPSGARSRVELPGRRLELAEAAFRPLPTEQLALLRARDASVPPAGGRAALARAGSAPGLASDILRLTQRQNE
ncbi:MAG TPA: hypothetical protein VEG34_19415 [Thermoanaerobaculia bacterium]|nr:hypothetical protein [Thermoanaerobaculia bacterium]